MLYKHTTTVGLVLALLGLASTVVFAQSDSGGPVSTGVVATITALDAKTGMATLTTEAGEVFELPQRSRWTMGDKVECDRIDQARPWLRDCRLWQVHEAGDTTAQPSRAAVPSAREGDVRFLATPSAPPADECKKLRRDLVNLERDLPSLATNAPARFMQELEAARQGVANCEAKGQ